VRSAGPARALARVGIVRDPDASERTRAPVLKRLLLIAAAILAFLLVSGVLARFLSVENTERDADLALIEAQAHGEEGKMLDRIHGCREQPRCVAAVRANLANPRLRRPGAVKILQLESHTSYSLTGATGNTRVAWTVIGTLPVVQCVRVRRSGNFLTGIKVTLLGLSAPIPNESGC
jgi:hypothetical protein